MARLTTSGLIGGISGELDGFVAVRTAGGLVLRKTPRRAPRRTPGQRAQEGRVRRIAALYGALEAEEVEAWRAYAARLCAAAPALERRPMSAYNAFLRLAGRRLMVAPEGPVSPLPPEGPFGGDAVRLRFEGAAGGVRATADRANSLGVATEILSQPLRRASRLPRTGAYVSRRFVTFEADAREALVALAPGAHALATRFVDRETGEATALLPMGTVVVPG